MKKALRWITGAVFLVFIAVAVMPVFWPHVLPEVFGAGKDGSPVLALLNSRQEVVLLLSESDGNSFVSLRNNGKDQISLRCMDSQSGLSLFDSEGRERAGLIALPGSTKIFVSGNDGREVACFEHKGGHVGLSLSNRDVPLSLLASRDGGPPELLFGDKNYRPRASMSQKGISLVDADGKVVWAVAPEKPKGEKD